MTRQPGSLKIVRSHMSFKSNQNINFSGFIYPIASHWAWHDKGWLKARSGDTLSYKVSYINDPTVFFKVKSDPKTDTKGPCSVLPLLPIPHPIATGSAGLLLKDTSNEC